VPAEIPPHIQAFIARHVPSIDHLEVLLWTREHRDRWFNAEALGSALGLSVPLAERILEELCSRNLLAVQVASAVCYQFSPATSELETLVTEFIAVLRNSRVRVYGLIASPAARTARDFADAFRFRNKHRG
jgi:hypothetical protein